MLRSRALAFFGSLAILCATWACDRPRAKLSDAQMQVFLDAYPGMTAECQNKLRYGGVEALPVRTDQCFEMTPSQRWRGVWIDAFEGSIFCPEPVEPCLSGKADEIWLEFRDESARPPQKEPGKVGGGSRYAIDFIGRKTLHPGQHGHMGMSQHEIIVDKVNALRPVTKE